MKQEEIIKILKEKKYKIYLYGNSEINNMQYWYDSQRVIVIKEYRTESSFLSWLREDQPVIGELYSNISSSFKNNLYFFMVINFKPDSKSTRLEINSALKNQYVCKKYVLNSISDLDKIPFLNDRVGNNKTFDFDGKFKNSLNKINKEKNFMEDSTIETAGNDFIRNTTKILDRYFEINSDNDEVIDELMVNILSKGDSNDYK